MRDGRIVNVGSNKQIQPLAGSQTRLIDLAGKMVMPGLIDSHTHPLGAAMTARLLGLGWIERGSRRRAVRVTPAGQEGLAATFGWSLEG